MKLIYSADSLKPYAGGRCPLFLYSEDKPDGTKDYRLSILCRYTMKYDVLQTNKNTKRRVSCLFIWAREALDRYAAGCADSDPQYKAYLLESMKLQEAIKNV